MPAYKDKTNGKWNVSFKYTDWKGNTVSKYKRGFKTKKEAIEYENNFMVTLAGKPDMLFKEFVEQVYIPYINPRTKDSTNEAKLSILYKFVMPYFGDKKLSEINNKMVINWQNMLMSLKNKKGVQYAPSYLKSIHIVLSAILNHAVKHYELSKNAASLVGSIGCDDAREEMKILTLEDYKKVRDEAMEDPIYYYIFEILYWTGIREGELLALTLSDIDFEKNTIRISKTYHRIGDRDIVTSPKTKQSNRTVPIPNFLAEEIKEYAETIYALDPKERLFCVPKSSLGRKLDKYTKKAGVQRIRVHDLRHSHVSLLINQGYTALAIAKRVGHKAIDITYRYAHLFPDTQEKIINTLEDLNK